MSQLPTQLPALPVPAPPDAYVVRGDDGLFYGWAQRLEQTITIAAAISMRSMIDLDVIDPSGNVLAHIGRFEPPLAQMPLEPLYLNAAADPDDSLLVHLAASQPGAQIDHGDGTSQTLHDTTEGTHRYAAAGGYQILASLGQQHTGAWINLEVPPTIPEEGA